MIFIAPNVPISSRCRSPVMTVSELAATAHSSTLLSVWSAHDVERFGGVPPFPETINYLQRVSYTTRIYRQRVHNRYLASVRMGTAAFE